jgi:hypothetical protein
MARIQSFMPEAIYKLSGCKRRGRLWGVQESYLVGKIGGGGMCSTGDVARLSVHCCYYVLSAAVSTWTGGSCAVNYHLCSPLCADMT